MEAKGEVTARVGGVGLSGGRAKYSSRKYICQLPDSKVKLGKKKKNQRRVFIFPKVLKTRLLNSNLKFRKKIELASMG